MAGNDQGGAPLRAGVQDRLLDAQSAFDVHAGRRFVEEQAGGPQNQPRGQGNPLRLAAGQLVPSAFGKGKIKSHHRQSLRHRCREIAAPLPEPQPIGDVVENRPPEQVGFLRQQGDAAV